MSESPSEQLPACGPDVVLEAQERIRSGRFAPGNRVAWKHGLRSQRQLPPRDATWLQDRIAAIVDSLGGPDALSPIALGVVKRHARLELADDSLWMELEQTGLSTGKGNTRAKAALWLSVGDRVMKSAQVLGLERKAKPVQSVTDLVERA